MKLKFVICFTQISILRSTSFGSHLKFSTFYNLLSPPQSRAPIFFDGEITRLRPPLSRFLLLCEHLFNGMFPFLILGWCQNAFPLEVHFGLLMVECNQNEGTTCMSTVSWNMVWKQVTYLGNLFFLNTINVGCKDMVW